MIVSVFFWRVLREASPLKVAPDIRDNRPQARGAVLRCERLVQKDKLARYAATDLAQEECEVLDNLRFTRPQVHGQDRRRPLRANIDETVLLVVITEQGEKRNYP